MIGIILRSLLKVTALFFNMFLIMILFALFSDLLWVAGIVLSIAVWIGGIFWAMVIMDRKIQNQHRYEGKSAAHSFLYSLILIFGIIGGIILIPIFFLTYNLILLLMALAILIAFILFSYFFFEKRYGM